MLRTAGAASVFTAFGVSTATDTASAAATTYANPVFEPVFPDPTVIEANGTYYAYGTESNFGDGVGYRVIPILSSDDLVNWTYEGEVFGTRDSKTNDEPSSGDPTWKYNDDGVWAPDIIHHDGRYVLYYSLHGPSHTDSAIGAATATSPTGPWTDQGEVVSGGQNCIDPEVVEHDGDLYMFFGSYSAPINVTRLTADGLGDTGEWTQISRDGDRYSAFEAPHVVKRNGKFVLFLQNDICCDGHASDPPYATTVARSDNIRGPYYDREGRDLMDRAAETEILASNERFHAPGHVTSAMGPDGDTRWLLYHAYDLQEPETTSGGSWRRSLMVDRIEWQDGWPAIRGGTPSRSAVSPTASDNSRPTAVASASDTSVSSGTTVTFDASASTDADSGVASYTWYLADGTVKTGQSVGHSYASSGEYPALLVVEDGVGYVDKDIVTVAVDGPVDSYRGTHLWTLDDGSGTTATDAVGGADGTLVNGPTWTSDAVQGGGLSFDGSNDYVDVGTNVIDTSSSYSVAAWVKLDSHANGWQTAVCQDGTEVSPFYLQYSANVNRLTFNVKAGDANGAHSVKVKQASRPDTDRWYHVVGVYDAYKGEVRLYVDGEREERKEFTGAWRSTGSTAIGRGYFGGSPADHWGGDVDHVQTFDQALTDAEARYVAGHVNYGTYRVEPTHTGGMAMEVGGGGTADGDDVQQWSWNGHDFQQWRFEHVGDDEYRLVNANSGKVLEVAGGRTTDGANVQQWSWNGSDAQRWRADLLDDGTYRLVNANSGKVLEVAGGGTSDGTNVQQWSWNGNDFQRWELDRL